MIAKRRSSSLSLHKLESASVMGSPCSLSGKNSMLLDNSRVIWNQVFLPSIAERIAAQRAALNLPRLLDQGGNPFLIARVESCGAAARGWPTASAVGLGIENLSREAAKESPPGPNS